MEALKQRQMIEQLEDDVRRYEQEGALAHQSTTQLSKRRGCRIKLLSCKRKFQRRRKAAAAAELVQSCAADRNISKT